MYATVKDLIRAERLQGMDAEFVDSDADKTGRACSRVGLVDEDIVTMSPEWAYQNANILVRHSMIAEPIARIGIPLIMAMHGRPEYSYMLEHYGESPVMKIVCNHEFDTKYAAYMTFWKEHQFFWSLMLPQREVFYVPCTVDLNKYNPAGEKVLLNANSGVPNILIADMWRQDITPFSVIEAAVLFRSKYVPTAKVQLFGLPPANKGFVSEYARRLNATGAVGETNTIVPFLEKVYRSVDILVTPNNIGTRIVREALASGLPVIAGSGCPYTKYTADPRDRRAFAAKINQCWTDMCAGKDLKQEARRTAETNFNYELAGNAMRRLCEKVLAERVEPTYPTLEWSPGTIDPTDWVVLRDILRERKIERVIEFGPGVSTQLMDRLGVFVHSFETDAIYFEHMKRRVKNAVIELWNGMFPPILGEEYQLAFIDGPSGGENREPSYRSVAESKIKLVACHDYKRTAERGWIRKYFGTWKEIARADESAQGLLILERP